MTKTNTWLRTHATEPPQYTDVLGLWRVDGTLAASVCWRDAAGQYRIPTHGDRTPAPVQPPMWWREIPAPPKGWEDYE
jgi:hypothetical protein